MKKQHILLGLTFLTFSLTANANTAQQLTTIYSFCENPKSYTKDNPELSMYLDVNGDVYTPQSAFNKARYSLEATRKAKVRAVQNNPNQVQQINSATNNSAKRTAQRIIGSMNTIKIRIAGQSYSLSTLSKECGRITKSRAPTYNNQYQEENTNISGNVSREYRAKDNAQRPATKGYGTVDKGKPVDSIEPINIGAPVVVEKNWWENK